MSRDEQIIRAAVQEAIQLKFADLLGNLKITWEKSGQDVDKFIENISTFVKNYLKRYNSPPDRNSLKDAVSKTTDEQVELKLNFKTNEWELKPAQVLVSKKLT